MNELFGGQIALYDSVGSHILGESLCATLAGWLEGIRMHTDDV